MPRLKAAIGEEKYEDWEALAQEKLKNDSELSGLSLKDVIMKYERFVYSKAGHFQRYASGLGSPLEIDDIASLGREGLIKSLIRYEQRPGVKFLSYAGDYIIKSMQRGIDESTYLKAAGQQKARKIKKARLKLSREGIENPTVESLSEETGIEIQEVKAMLGALNLNIVSINRPFMDGENEKSLEDVLASNRSIDNIEKNIEKDKHYGLIPQAIKAAELSEREGEILNRYFNEGKNLTEIGHELNLQPQRVSLIFELITRRIRKCRNQLGIESQPNYAF